jgi:3-phenylpropionate/trans-cinnamate dioxygenase ferredoxin subunit
MGDWERVGAVGDVKPGQVVQVTAGGEPVALGNVDGELLAIGDICSHEYVELHGGWLEGDEIECPQHGSKFSMRTGAPRGLPATRPVPAYEVKVEDGDIYVRPVEAPFRR